MLAQMANDGMRMMMDGPMMSLCMIGGTLATIAIFVILILQTLIQRRILKEIRKSQGHDSNG